MSQSVTGFFVRAWLPFGPRKCAQAQSIEPQVHGPQAFSSPISSLIFVPRVKKRVIRSGKNEIQNRSFLRPRPTQQRRNKSDRKLKTRKYQSCNRSSSSELLSAPKRFNQSCEESNRVSLRARQRADTIVCEALSIAVATLAWARTTGNLNLTQNLTIECNH